MSTKEGKDAVSAMIHRKPYKKGNTLVTHTGDVSMLYLFNNHIATLDRSKWMWEITTAGYPTTTTFDRLNSIYDVGLWKSNGVTHLNGCVWDGSWIKIAPVFMPAEGWSALLTSEQMHVAATLLMIGHEPYYNKTSDGRCGWITLRHQILPGVTFHISCSPTPGMITYRSKLYTPEEFAEGRMLYLVKRSAKNG